MRLDLHAIRLGETIARLRDDLGMTQADLAAKASLTQQQLSKLEKAKGCNLETLLKVCEALDMDLGLKPRAEDMAPPSTKTSRTS